MIPKEITEFRGRTSPNIIDMRGHFRRLHCEVCGTRIIRDGQNAPNKPLRCEKHWPDSKPIK